MKDLGTAGHMFGWSITRDPISGTLHISQPHLAQSYIDLLRMQDAIPSDTPYASGLQLDGLRQGEEPLDQKCYPYGRAVGILRYLVDSTRPEISYIVGMLARNLKQPTRRHWLAAKQMARYLKGTLWHGLAYTAGDVHLTAQSDSDFAGCKDTRQSTYGNLIYLRGNLISWWSRRIKTVVTSTFAAEYIAASNTALNISWIRQMLSEIMGTTIEPTLLQMDNMAAIDVAKAKAPTKRSKYIDVRFDHVQDKIRAGIIQPMHTSSALLQADALTKPLTRDKFIQHRAKLCVAGTPQNIPTAVGVS